MSAFGSSKNVRESNRLLRLNSNSVASNAFDPSAGRRHDPAGAAAVLGAVVVHEHLELAHRLDAQQSAGGAAGRAVALRVRVGAVDLVADLIRTRAGNRHLRAHAAVHLLLRAGRRGDARLQQRQLAEVAPFNGNSRICSRRPARPPTTGAC
jgi:hypothetical protein